MAHSWQYPRWRRILMQVIMILILAGTIGLAELVTRQRNHTRPINLTQTRMLDNRLVVKLPAGWSIDLVDTYNLIAREPTDEGRSRILTVQLKRAPGVRSAEEFMERSGVLSNSVAVNPDDDSDPGVSDDAESPATKSLKMAGLPAIMARVLLARGMPPTVRTQYVVAALVADQTVLILRLDSPDTDSSDVALVQQLAAAMSLLGESPLDNPSTVLLPSGVRFPQTKNEPPSRQDAKEGRIPLGVLATWRFSS